MDIVWLRRSGGKVTAILDTITNTRSSLNNYIIHTRTTSTVMVTKALPNDHGEYLCVTGTNDLIIRSVTVNIIGRAALDK